jgi:DNA-binding NtrC family response regulator
MATKETLRTEYFSHERIAGTHLWSDLMLQLIPQIGTLNVPIMILGEAGTAKERLALALHNFSQRAHRNFISYNCERPRLPEAAEKLFGKRPGSNVLAKKGLVELADGGTLFLNNFSALSPSIQTELVGLVKDQQFQREGGETIKSDVRLICADSPDLGLENSRRTIVSSLFYCFSILLKIPPLRSRKEEIPQLVKKYLLTRGCVSTAKKPVISPAIGEVLKGYDWPGNDQELEEVLESVLRSSGGFHIGPHHLPVKLFSFSHRFRRSDKDNSRYFPLL